MGIPGRFHDGLSAAVHLVELDYERRGEEGTLIVRDAGQGSELARWPAAELYAVHAPKDVLRLAANRQPTGARVIVEGHKDIGRIMATLPVLHHKRRQETQRQVRIAVTATVALASVIVSPTMAIGVTPSDAS